jgi:hypothetical protein
VAIGYVQSALARGHKVMYLADRDDVDAFAARLAGLDEQLAAALDSGQFSVREAADVYAPDGIFEYRVMLESIARARSRLQEG